MLKFKLARKNRSAYVRADCVAAVVESLDQSTIGIYLTSGASIEVEASATAILEALEAARANPSQTIEVA